MSSYYVIYFLFICYSTLLYCNVLSLLYFTYFTLLSFTSIYFTLLHFTVRSTAMGIRGSIPIPISSNSEGELTEKLDLKIKKDEVENNSKDVTFDRNISEEYSLENSLTDKEIFEESSYLENLSSNSFSALKVRVFHWNYLCCEMNYLFIKIR